MEQALWHVELVGRDWPHMDRVDRLVYETLYKTVGIAADDPWHEETPEAVWAVAVAGERLLGSALLLGKPGEDRQLRQVAVEPATQGLGVGRALVESLERRAADEGSHRVFLYARESAFGFYERLGYEFESDVFRSQLTGIPHRTMAKRLGPPPA